MLCCMLHDLQAGTNPFTVLDSAGRPSGCDFDRTIDLCVRVACKHWVACLAEALHIYLYL